MPSASSDTASDLIRERLKADIVDARLWPGMALDEKALSAQYGVSRTPVRDALLQLSALGLVRIVPRVGIFVARIGDAELADMFEALAHLEGLCAGLAALRIGPAGRTQLLRAHRAAHPRRAGGQTGAYDAANTAFHEALDGIAGNACLVEQIRTLRNRTHPYRLRHFDETDRMTTSWHEHDAIVAAVLDGDAAAAQHAAARHVAQGRSDFSGFLARFPEGLFRGAPPRPPGRLAPGRPGACGFVMPSPWMSPIGRARPPALAPRPQ